MHDKITTKMFFIFSILVTVVCASGELVDSFGGSEKVQERILAPNSANSGSPLQTLAETFWYGYRSNMPVVLLIDDTKEAHEDAEHFVNTTDQLNLNTAMVELLLMKFNATGN